MPKYIWRSAMSAIMDKVHDWAILDDGEGHLRHIQMHLIGRRRPEGMWIAANSAIRNPLGMYISGMSIQ